MALTPRPERPIDSITVSVIREVKQAAGSLGLDTFLVGATARITLAHRDWTRFVDIEVGIYTNRVEVISPGALQNSMTIEKMIAGQRSPRNPIIMEVLRDYGYVDSRGMGVRTKIIPLMKQFNHAAPIFEATEDYLKTILPKKRNIPGASDKEIPA
jgi:predicted transcriptional regulator